MKDRLLESTIQSRTLVLSDGVSSEMVSKAVPLLTFMDAESNDPITVLVNSPGGEAYSGLGLYDTLRFVKSPIRIVVNGLCASAGILLLLAGDKGQRFTLPNSRFMIHQPRGGARGQSSDIQIEAKEINKLREVYFQIIASECGKTEDEVRKDADRDLWLSAEEALKYGIVDKIITHRGEID